MKQLPSTIKSPFDLDQFRLHIDGSGVKMAYAQGSISEPDHPILGPYIREIEGLTGQKSISMMLNIAEYGVIVPIHTDTLEHPGDRYHLPLMTNENALWWGEDDGYVHMDKGIWYGPVQYWKDHTIMNLGREVRVHLVIDLERK